MKKRRSPGASRRTRRGDPETSFAAAESILGGITRIQAAVVAAHAEAGEGGLTMDELEARLNGDTSTYRTRRSELEGMGVIRRTDRTRSYRGREQGVYVLAAHKPKDLFS